MDKKKEFVVAKFIADGCPEEDARNETWESMVENLFDGNEQAAIDEMNLLIQKTVVTFPANNQEKFEWHKKVIRRHWHERTNVTSRAIVKTQLRLAKKTKKEL